MAVTIAALPTKTPEATWCCCCQARQSSVQNSRPPRPSASARLLPPGFMPLPHVKQATGGQVFPNNEIETIQNQEARNLRRFDVDFDLPDHLTPEFPPPIFSQLIPSWATCHRASCLPSRTIMP